MANTPGPSPPPSMVRPRDQDRRDSPNHAALKDPASHGDPPAIDLSPLLPDARHGSHPHSHHVAERLYSEAERLGQHVRPLRSSRIFMYLTIIAAVMIFINILQAFLIDTIQSFWWIVIFPLVVFVGSLSVLFVSGLVGKKELISAWQKSSVPERTARAGVVLAIVFPIVACQFLYLPLVAVPAWHDIEWSLVLTASNTRLYPAFLFWVNPTNYQVLTDPAPKCTIQNDPTDPSNTNCNISDFTSVHPSPTGHGIVSAVTFNPLDQPGGPITTDFTKNDTNVIISWSFNYTGDGDGATTLGIVAYDPYLPFQSTDISVACGNPPFYTIVQTPLTDNSTFNVFAETYEMYDKVGALESASLSPDCSPGFQGVTNYTHFDLRLNPTFSGSALSKTSSCAVNGNYTNACTVSINLLLQDALVTQQQSSHGTDTVKILIDEGAIVGAIAFFTWFCGIFVI